MLTFDTGRLRFSGAAVFLLAAAFSSRAAAQAAPGAAPATAPAPSPDRWYKIELQSRHLGYARRAVTPFQDKDQALLRVVEETSFSDPVSGYPASSREESVLLASDLTLVSYRFTMEMTVAIGRVALDVSCESQGKGKWVGVHQGPKGRFPVELTSDDPVTVEGVIPLLLARNPAMLKEGGVVRYRVINAMQFDRMLLDMEVNVRRPESRTYMDKEMQVIPFAYRIPSMAAEEQDTFTQYMTDDGEVMEVAAVFGGSGLSLTLTRVATEEKALPDGKRLLKQRGRRDPFDRNKALTPRGGEKPVPQKPEEGKKGGPKPPVTPADVARMFSELRQLVKTTEDLSRQPATESNKKKVQDAYGRFLDVKLLVEHEELTQAQKNDLENLRGRMEQIFPGAQGVVEEAKKLKDKAEKAFEAQSYAEVHQLVEDIKNLRDRKEISGRPEEQKKLDDEALRLAQKLEERIKAREEFKTVKLEVTGVIYNLVETAYPVGVGVRVLGQDLRVADSVRIPVSRSGAIVNGVGVGEGDVLDPKKGELRADLGPEEGVVVARIRQDAVVFRYKEEEIEVPLKQQ